MDWDTLDSRIGRIWCRIFGHKWGQRITGSLCRRCRLFSPYRMPYTEVKFYEHYEEH